MVILGIYKLDLEVISFVGNLEGCMGQERLTNAPLPSHNTFFFSQFALFAFVGQELMVSG